MNRRVSPNTHPELIDSKWFLDHRGLIFAKKEEQFKDVLDFISEFEKSGEEGYLHWRLDDFDLFFEESLLKNSYSFTFGIDDRFYEPNEKDKKLNITWTWTNYYNIFKKDHKCF